MPEQQQTDRERDAEIAIALGWTWRIRDHRPFGMSQGPLRVIAAPDSEESRLSPWDGIRELRWAENYGTPLPRFHTDPAAVFGPGGLVEVLAKEAIRKPV